jgi:hypothetical protein
VELRAKILHAAKATAESRGLVSNTVLFFRFRYLEFRNCSLRKQVTPISVKQITKRGLNFFGFNHKIKNQENTVFSANPLTAYNESNLLLNAEINSNIYATPKIF